jgi:hypothetical protein
MLSVGEVRSYKLERVGYLLLTKAQGLELEVVYAAVRQDAAFALKDQNCVAHSGDIWASIKIRLDYGHRTETVSKSKCHRVK